MKTTDKLITLTLEDEIIYIPIIEATFVLKNKIGIITWNNKEFSLDLDNDSLKTWEKWIKIKVELTSAVLDSVDVTSLVQELVTENLKVIQKQHANEIAAVRNENVKEMSSIRKEYQDAQHALTVLLDNSVNTIINMSNKVSKDMETVSKTAVDFSKIKKDFKEITKMFESLLDTE